MTFDPTSLTGLVIVITAFGGAFLAALVAEPGGMDLSRYPGAGA